MLIKLKLKNELNKGIQYLIVATKARHFPVLSIQPHLTLIWMCDCKKVKELSSLVMEDLGLINLDRTNQFEIEFINSISNFE